MKITQQSAITGPKTIANVTVPAIDYYNRVGSLSVSGKHFPDKALDGAEITDVVGRDLDQTPVTPYDDYQDVAARSWHKSFEATMTGMDAEYQKIKLFKKTVTLSLPTAHTALLNANQGSIESANSAQMKGLRFSAIGAVGLVAAAAVGGWGFMADSAYGFAAIPLGVGGGAMLANGLGSLRTASEHRETADRYEVMANIARDWNKILNSPPPPITATNP